MTAEERSQWISVARQTLSGIPADLMERGAKAARAKCRFPSEIVPAILSEVEDIWRKRKAWAAEERKRSTLRLEKPDKVTPEEAAAILVEFGLNRSPDCGEAA